MKKILASCLTCCALLGSMCFSSPLAQLHATSTTAEQSESKTITLNVKEKAVAYTHSLSATEGSTIQIYNGDSSLPMAEYTAIRLTDDGASEGKFKISGFENQDTASLIFKFNDIEYTIDVIKPGPDAGVTEHSGPIKIDISKTKDYSCSFETEPPTSVPITVTPSEQKRLEIDKTKAELPVGSAFKLDLSDGAKNALGETRRFYLNSLTINGKYVDMADEYIHETGYEQDEDNYWQYRLCSTVKAGDKITFNAVAKAPEISSIDDNTTLVNYNADPPSETEPGAEITYPHVVDPANQNQINFPVELTITDDGKGDPIDEKDEMGVFLKLAPEYKKLTSKDETYKIDANVEIDEDESADNKEIFESLKADGAFKVSFVSRDTSVATVSEDGTVTAVANGSTEILAYVEGYEDELFGTSKVDVEIPEEEAVVEEEESSYPKTGDNFMAVSAAILTLGLSALVVAFMSKKQKDVNEEK